MERLCARVARPCTRGPATEDPTPHVDAPGESDRRRGAAGALLLSAFWGANLVAIKFGLEDAPPIRLAWMRFLVGGLVILAWGWVTGHLRGLRIERHEWRPLVVLALLGMQMRHPSAPAARTRPIVLRKVYVTTVVQRVPAGASASPRPASVTQTVSSAPTSSPAPAAPVVTRSSGTR